MAKYIYELEDPIMGNVPFEYDRELSIDEFQVEVDNFHNMPEYQAAKAAADEKDYLKRLKTARQKQAKESTFFTTPKSVAKDAASRGSKARARGKNIAKGIVDLLNVPSRVVGALTDQEFKDPNAYLAKKPTEWLASMIKSVPMSSAGGDVTLAPRVLSKIVEFGGQALSDPLTYPTAFLGPIAKGLLKGALRIRPKAAKEFSRVVRSKDLLPTRAGRKSLVDFIVDEDLYSPKGFSKTQKLTDAALKKNIAEKASTLRTAPGDAMIRSLKDALKPKALAERIRPTDPNAILPLVDVTDVFSKVKLHIRTGITKVAPEKTQQVLKELDKLEEVYTTGWKTNVFSLGSPTLNAEGKLKHWVSPDDAEKLRQQLGKGQYKTPTIFDHPVKAQARELAEREMYDAIQDALSKAGASAVQNDAAIRKLKIVKEVIENAAEKHDAGGVVKSLVGSGAVGGTTKFIDMLTQLGSGRTPSLMLQLDKLNKLGIFGKRARVPIPIVPFLPRAGKQVFVEKPDEEYMKALLKRIDKDKSLNINIGSDGLTIKRK